MSELDDQQADTKRQQELEASKQAAEKGQTGKDDAFESEPEPRTGGKRRMDDPNEVVDIRFDPQNPPPEIRERLNDKQLEDLSKSYKGDVHYYSGPATEDMNLKNTHHAGYPSDWYDNAKNFDEHQLGDSVTDTKDALKRGGDDVPEDVRKKADDYIHSSATDQSNLDLRQTYALQSERDYPKAAGETYQARDAEGTLNIPKGAHVEYIEGTVAPQTSERDERFGDEESPGGGHQIWMLDHDQHYQPTERPLYRDYQFQDGDAETNRAAHYEPGEHQKDGAISGQWVDDPGPDVEAQRAGLEKVRDGAQGRMKDYQDKEAEAKDAGDLDAADKARESYRYAEDEYYDALGRLKKLE